MASSAEAMRRPVDDAAVELLRSLDLRPETAALGDVSFQILHPGFHLIDEAGGGQEEVVRRRDHQAWIGNSIRSSRPSRGRYRQRLMTPGNRQLEKAVAEHDRQTAALPAYGHSDARGSTQFGVAVVAYLLAAARGQGVRLRAAWVRAARQRASATSALACPLDAIVRSASRTSPCAYLLRTASRSQAARRASMPMHSSERPPTPTVCRGLRPSPGAF